MAAILCDGSFQNNPEVREFLFREPVLPASAQLIGGDRAWP
jgi:hypothetical protein